MKPESSGGNVRTVCPDCGGTRTTYEMRSSVGEYGSIADHVAAVYRLLPSHHRLPLLFLDWSGARVAAIDKTLVGDFDEPSARVRLRRAVTKTKRGVWIELHPDLDAATCVTGGSACCICAVSRGPG